MLLDAEAGGAEVLGVGSSVLLRFDREAHTLGVLRSDFYGQVLTLTLALTPPGTRTLIRAQTLTSPITSPSTSRDPSRRAGANVQE